MTTIQQIARALVLVAVVLLVGVFVVQAFPQAIGADHSFVVLSGSMEPTISSGDVVIVSSVPPDTIESNDIITYRRASEETPVTHRVLEVVETDSGLEFVTKGDANEDADPARVPASNLLGAVSFVIPYAGYVVQFANTRLGTIVLIGVPLGLLVVTEVVSFVFDRASEPESNPASEPIHDSESHMAAEGVENAAVDGELPAGAGVSESEDSDAIALTTTDLRLSGLAFVSFSVYAGWMAYQHPGGLTIGVAMATVSAVLLIALVFIAGEPENATSPQGQVTDGGFDFDEQADETEGDSP